MTIRSIRKNDNIEIARVIRGILMEMEVPKIGTAYADPELDALYEAYTDLKSTYFVVEQDGRIMGGAGIAPLANYDGNVCELQKMYFSGAVRRKGIGAQMMALCLAFAKKKGYDHIYIETMPTMIAAQKLYLSVGFTYLDEPLGNTGHSSCPIYMIKKL